MLNSLLPVDCRTPGFPDCHQLWKLDHTHVHQVSDAIQSSHPLSSLSPPAFIFPSIRIFSHDSALCVRWPRYWSFSISPSNEYLKLISFKIDWFDLLAVQGILKSLLQHYNSKASFILRRSVFFALLQPYMTTGKNITLIYTDLCQQSDVSAF